MDVGEINFQDEKWFEKQKKSAGKKSLDVMEYLAQETQKTPTFIAAIYRKQSSESVLGEPTGVTFGTNPPKKSLLDKSRDYDVHQALGELIDNILQNHITNLEAGTQAEDLLINIDVVIQRNDIEGSLIIDENSGGIPEDKLNSFITLGASEWEEIENNGVGTWGSGAKVALACLGRWNVVYTRPWGETQRNFQMGDADEPEPDGGTGEGEDPADPKNYYHDKNLRWEVDDRKGKEIAEGHTLMEVKRLTPWARDFFTSKEVYLSGLRQLRKFFHSKVRAIRAMDSEVSIAFTNLEMDDPEDVEIELTKWMEGFSNYCGDYEEYLDRFCDGLFVKSKEFDLTLRKAGCSDLRMHIVIGPTQHFAARGCGFIMWGNERLFSDVVIPASITSGNPETHEYAQFAEQSARDGSWLGFVKFESNDPRAIPWKGPIKWEYHCVNQDFADEIESILGRVATSYVAQSKYLSQGEGLSLQNDYLVGLGSFNNDREEA